MTEEESIAIFDIIAVTLERRLRRYCVDDMVDEGPIEVRSCGVASSKVEVDRLLDQMIREIEQFEGKFPFFLGSVDIEIDEMLNYVDIKIPLLPVTVH